MNRSLLKRIGGFIGLVALMALACNAPIGGSNTPAPPPPATSAVTTPQPTQTPVESPTVPAEETPVVLPTFTPIQATVPSGSTATVTATATETTPPATATETADSGPLSFTYTIQWEVSAGNPGVAIATVMINATGGGGGYHYFRDDLPVAGPVFTYEWATCRANPGSLRVDSADGQTVRTDYYENPPCP
ncbi:MAG: hypothetical protein WAM60_02830 [Candidatus Promineifilaceae bacterium]